MMMTIDAISSSPDQRSTAFANLDGVGVALCDCAGAIIHIRPQGPASEGNTPPPPGCIKPAIAGTAAAMRLAALE